VRKEVLPTTFDISFQDLSGAAIRKHEMWVAFSTTSKTQGVQSKK
jgi:hypothetical protein